ncbi:ribosome recycling factor [Haliovirga abyssi]|uniref:Ribosome-recycling factor n=1 Tax=Haliovirga abyssi TaxID=2996794 RepID=A0AAU9D538_9FUSO|nr:ribosome recycling factor [Haliovirga abyssi]BDU49668.1 ribosome-recycling factor [Haliovirga abyssi]
MAETLMKEIEERMQKSIDATKGKLAAIRAGRASINMLDGIMVNYYGNPTPLNQVANLSAPEARALTIEPWDINAIKDIEKAIQMSNLGLTPNNNGKLIRLQIPELTEERRKDYLKLAKKEDEDGKIAIRNVRKDINNKLRKMQKDSDITEDELKSYETKVQKITDKYIKNVDELFVKKEKEIMGK